MHRKCNGIFKYPEIIFQTRPPPTSPLMIICDSLGHTPIHFIPETFICIYGPMKGFRLNSFPPPKKPSIIIVYFSKEKLFILHKSK